MGYHCPCNTGVRETVLYAADARSVERVAGPRVPGLVSESGVDKVDVPHIVRRQVAAPRDAVAALVQAHVSADGLE